MTITKQDKRTDRIFEIWKEMDEDSQFALDIAVMELILGELAKHRDEITAKAEELQKKEIRKIYRAATRTMLSKHLQGQHDQKEHGNWAKQIQSFVQEALRGGEPQQLSLFGDDSGVGTKQGLRNIFGALAALPSRIMAITSAVAEGMHEFLKPTTWGSRIIAGAEFLSKTGSRIAETAKLIATYGPLAGVRMARAYYRYGGFDVPLPEVGSKQWDKVTGGVPSNATVAQTRNTLINALKGRLPDQETLELSAGSSPSEGFLIAPDGTITAHAFGRGNDFFLPFGLRHLRMLRKNKGGEWVRSRALGGLTSEDLHAAMMLGADKVTVVSNSGVFTLDLTDRAKGLHSEHVQILSRFQDLLRTQAGGRFDFEAYDLALKALALEFPLHFRSHDGRRGRFPNLDDQAFPKKSFVDEIREIFGVDAAPAGRGSDLRDALIRAGADPGPNRTASEQIERLQQRARAGDDAARRQLSRVRSFIEGDTPTTASRGQTEGEARRIPRPVDPTRPATRTFVPRGTTDTGVRTAQASPERRAAERDRMLRIQRQREQEMEARTISRGRDPEYRPEADVEEAAGRIEAMHDALRAMGIPQSTVEQVGSEADFERLLDATDFGQDDDDRWYQ